MQSNGFTTGYVNLAVKCRLKDIYLQQWYEDKQKYNFNNTWSWLQSKRIKYLDFNYMMTYSIWN